MSRIFALCSLYSLIVAAMPAGGQGTGAAGIQQVPVSPSAVEQIGVAPVDAGRSSATVQSATAESVPPPVSAETLAACRRARAQDRPAPKGVDCIRALQVATPPAPATAAPTAENSLMSLFGQRTDNLGSGGTAAAPTSADQVARQLSSGDFQGTVGSDVAASVARDRAPSSANPPPANQPR